MKTKSQPENQEYFFAEIDKLVAADNPKIDELFDKYDDLLKPHILPEFYSEKIPSQLMTKENSKEMQMLIAAALNVSLYKKYKGKLNSFQYLYEPININTQLTPIEEGEFKEYIEVTENIVIKKRNSTLSITSNANINYQTVIKGIKEIKEHYIKLRALDKDMKIYLQEVKEAYKENNHYKIIQATNDIAAKHSDLNKEQRIAKAKEMLKEMVAKERAKQDFLYPIKEACKWMLNKITFGLSPASASQQIDAIFERASKDLEKIEEKTKQVDPENLVFQMERGELRNLAELNSENKPYKILSKNPATVAHNEDKEIALKPSKPHHSVKTAKKPLSNEGIGDRVREIFSSDEGNVNVANFAKQNKATNPFKHQKPTEGQFTEKLGKSRENVTPSPKR